MSVDELYVRILELETRFGLIVEEATYSERIIAVLDALEDEAYEGAGGDDEDTVESKLAGLKHLLGDIGEEAQEGLGEVSIEAKIAEIKQILD